MGRPPYASPTPERRSVTIAALCRVGLKLADLFAEKGLEVTDVPREWLQGCERWAAGEGNGRELVRYSNALTRTYAEFAKRDGRLPVYLLFNYCLKVSSVRSYVSLYKDHRLGDLTLILTLERAGECLLHLGLVTRHVDGNLVAKRWYLTERESTLLTNPSKTPETP